jgi:hypothetical protein
VLIVGNSDSCRQKSVNAFFAFMHPWASVCHTKNKTSQILYMFGKFQQTQLRIELDASATAIHDSLLLPMQLEKWLLPGKFTAKMPTELHSGLQFTRQVGLIPIHHQVDVINTNSLRLILSQGIDGFHEWYWGDGWVQSRIEGISILPLSLAHTASLLSLRQYLQRK